MAILTAFATCFRGALRVVLKIAAAGAAALAGDFALLFRIHAREPAPAATMLVVIAILNGCHMCGVKNKRVGMRDS